MYGRISDPGMGPYPPRVLLAPRTSANHRSADGGGVSTPCGAVLTRAIAVCVPSWSELQMYGGVSDPGMGPFPPRVRWDLDGSIAGIIPFSTNLLEKSQWPLAWI